MNIEEYKALMLYELLMSGDDLSEYNYAAVDHDGLLHAYETQPKVDTIFDDWTNKKETFWIYVCSMTPPEKWKDTLIKL